MRRGLPTLHRQYDEATALLAGDALLASAFDILAEEASHAHTSTTNRDRLTTPGNLEFRGFAIVDPRLFSGLLMPLRGVWGRLGGILDPWGVSMPLTAMDVKNAQARERDYKLFDSKGLYLLVTENPMSSSARLAAHPLRGRPCRSLQGRPHHQRWSPADF